MSEVIVLLFSQRISPNLDLFFAIISHSSSLIISILLPGGVPVMTVNYMTVCFCAAAVTLA